METFSQQVDRQIPLKRMQNVRLDSVDCIICEMEITLRLDDKDCLRFSKRLLKGTAKKGTWNFYGSEEAEEKFKLLAYRKIIEIFLYLTERPFEYIFIQVSLITDFAR